MADMYLELYDECTKMRCELDQEVKNVTDDKTLQLFLDKVDRLRSKYVKLRRMEEQEWK
jgi:SET domain-containing protein